MQQHDTDADDDAALMMYSVCVELPFVLVQRSWSLWPRTV